MPHIIEEAGKQGRFNSRVYRVKVCLFTVSPSPFHTLCMVILMPTEIHGMHDRVLLILATMAIMALMALMALIPLTTKMLEMG